MISLRFLQKTQVRKQICKWCWGASSGSQQCSFILVFLLATVIWSILHQERYTFASTSIGFKTKVWSSPVSHVDVPYCFTPCHNLSYCFILLHTVSYCFVRWVELKTTRKQHVCRSSIMNADRIPASFGFFLKPGFGWTRYSRLVLSQAHLRRHTVQKSYLELLRKTRQQWSQSPGENVDTLPQSIPKRPWAWSTSWSCFRWVRLHAFIFFSGKLPDQ